MLGNVREQYLDVISLVTVDVIFFGLELSQAHCCVCVFLDAF